jgi:hypothetical protein
MVPSQRRHEGLTHILNIYPAGTHFTLIAFLFVLALEPAVDLFRRYRHNWRAKAQAFTVFDGITLFIVGWIGNAMANPHSLEYFADYAKTQKDYSIAKR